MTETTTTNAASLDMSLDQLIKHNKEMRRGGRRRPRGGRGNRGGYPRGYGGSGSLGPFRNRQMKRSGLYTPYVAAAAAVPSKAS